MGSHTAFVKEKREYVETDDMETMALQDELISLEDKISVIWEPVYERYEKDEILLDPDGNPVAEMVQVPVFEEREISYVTTEKELLSAVWDPVKKNTGSRWKIKQTGQEKQRQ